MAATTIEACVKDGLALEPAERELLATEALEFAETLKDAATRSRYVELSEGAAAGQVPERLVPSLEAMLELLLQTQQTRRRHGPEGERALSDLFYRTPRGAGLRQAARDVNRALEAIRDQTIEKLTVMSGPGRHTLLLHTDRCQLTLKLDAAGARVEKVEVGG